MGGMGKSKKLGAFGSPQGAILSPDSIYCLICTGLSDILRKQNYRWSEDDKTGDARRTSKTIVGEKNNFWMAHEGVDRRGKNMMLYL